MEQIFRRRYLISLSYMLIAVVGIVSWMNIPMEMAPDLNLPVVTVNYSWGSTSPEVMEQEITRRVEQAAMRLRNVERIRSISREGSSSVTVTFEKEAPVEYRVLELQEYLHSLRESLPPDVRPPSVNRSIPEELQAHETFMIYSISGDRPEWELYQYAMDQIRLPLLGYEGLSDIEILGAEDPALTIRFYTEMTERYGVDSADILRSIVERLNWRSAGFTEEYGSRYSTLIPPRFHSVDDIRNLEIQLPGTHRQVLLSEISQINIEDYPVKSLKRLNGQPALTIEFVRQTGSDAMQLAETVREEMERIRSMLPSDMSIQLERDSTEELRRQFADLEYQSMFSLLVVFVILLLFIRRVRAPFVILGSILFSLLMSLSILFFLDYTLNVLTLAGLTVALGMIIDNGVVVFEQINPGLPKEREDRMAHMRKELPYALVPVMGSTLTTVGIFLPLFFAMEELQLFLVPLAVALTLTLACSLLVALSWVPYSLIWLVPPVSGVKERALKKKVNRLLNRTLLETFYWRHRFRYLLYVALVVAIGIPIFAIDDPDWEETRWPEFTRVYFDNRGDIDPLVGGITYKFFNDVYFGTPWGGRPQEIISVNIRTPQGTPMEEIDKMARNFETIAAPYAAAFEYYETTVSEYSGAQLRFYLLDEFLYRPEPYRFLGEAMFLASRTGNSGISVSGLGDSHSTGFGGSFGGGQRISLRGYAYDELLTLAEDIAHRLQRNPRVQGVDIHGQSDLFHYVLDLDEDRLMMKGLDRRDVLEAISLDVNPTNEWGTIELGGERMRLIGRNQIQSRYDEELMQRARLSRGQYFTLDDIAGLSRDQTLPQITRENQAYQRTVVVDFLGPYRLAQNYIESVLEEVPVPVGASIQYGGGGIFGWGQQDQLMNTLLLLFLTVLSVWMIVSALLENWVDPMVVILAVPLSLLGVMIGALVHDISFDRGAIAGTLLAVGVVVNNSILLIHEKQRCRALGIHRLRSWVRVYRNKMRAVMITSLTTMGGLVPMVVIGSDPFWRDLAVVVIWGLGTSLTLLLLMMGVWEKTRISVS